MTPLDYICGIPALILLGILSLIFEFVNKIRGIEEPETEYRNTGVVPEGIFQNLLMLDARWETEATRHDGNVNVISPPGWRIDRRQQTYTSLLRPHLTNLHDILQWEKDNTFVSGYVYEIQHPKKGTVAYETDTEGRVVKQL